MNILYKHIAIDGGIGAGKSTLAEAIASELGVAPILEPFEGNPFLAKFYEDPERYAFPVELSFLAQRFHQMKAAVDGRNLFQGALVSDYVFTKSLLFAKTNLPAEEFELFKHMSDLMVAQLPKPEVVLYLRPGRERQRVQIKARGRAYEQSIQDAYLDQIESAYENQFRYARGSRMLWVDTSPLDFVKSAGDLNKLIQLLTQPWKVGVHKVALKA